MPRKSVKRYSYVGEAEELRKAISALLKLWDEGYDITSYIDTLRKTIGQKPKEPRYSWTDDYYKDDK